MTHSAAAIEERWGFLEPWCDVPNGRLVYDDDSYEKLLWAANKHCLCIKLEDDEVETDMISLERVREGLLISLLAAVAHVDNIAVKYLLGKYCEVEGDEGIEDIIPFRFVVKRNVERYGALPGFMLEELCGTKQRERPSEEYIEALRKISAFETNLNPNDGGVDVQVPIRVRFLTGFDGGTLDEFKDIMRAETRIREMWDEYDQENGVESGLLRCTLLLEPMFAEFSEMPISTGMTEVIGRAIVDNMLFTEFSFQLHFDERLKADKRSCTLTLCQLLTAVFNTSRQSIGTYHSNYCLLPDESNPLQLGRILLECVDDELRPSEFESVCSALVVNQMAKSLSIALELEADNNRQSRHWWRWLAYGLFSARARRHSILEHLVLDSVGHISVEDIENFAAVLSSEHPEEFLTGTPRGLVDEREGGLRSRAPIRWKFDEYGQPNEDEDPLVFDFPIPLVQTFSDDGKSEWIDVMVPGCGRCQVRRKDLVFSCDESVQVALPGITSLKVRFTIETEVADGLPNLLATVGASLKFLTLHGRRELLGDDLFIGSCPNLLELSLRGSVVEARLDFRDYHVRWDDLPPVSCNWQDVAILSQALMNVDSLLTMCLHQLRIRLANKWLAGAVPQGYDTTRYESDLDAVLGMLEVNRSLEHLEVVVPTLCASYASKFAEFHLKPIDRPLQLPLEVKIAFLSVVWQGKSPEVGRKRNREISPPLSGLCKLDQLVLSNIFAFAVPPVLRQVFFRTERELDFGGGVDWVLDDGGAIDGDDWYITDMSDGDY